MSGERAGLANQPGRSTQGELMGSTDNLGTPGRMELGTSKVPSGTHLESVMNISCTSCSRLLEDRGGDRPWGVGI